MALLELVPLLGGAAVPKPVGCLACGERLPSARALVTHLVRRHFRGSPFPCPSCGAAVLTVRQLQHHLRRHAGERLHPCSRCARPFATASSLRRHERLGRCADRHHALTHEPRRRKRGGKCAACGTRFAVLAELYAHERSIHDRYRTYACDLCELAFSRSASLLKHLQRAHATTTASRLHLAHHAAPLTPPPSPPPSTSAAPERPDDLELTALASAEQPALETPSTPPAPPGPAEPASLAPTLQHHGVGNLPPKKRGRPRKSEQRDKSAPALQNCETDNPPPKKRGRPRKSEQRDKSVQRDQSEKRDKSEQRDKSAPALQNCETDNPPPKKRGRPRKSEKRDKSVQRDKSAQRDKSEQRDMSASALQNCETENPPPKKRGRPRKSEQRDKPCSEKQREGPGQDPLEALRLPGSVPPESAGPSSPAASPHGTVHSAPKKRGRTRRPEQSDRRCNPRLSVKLFGKPAETRLEKWRRYQLVRRQSLEMRRLAAPMCLPLPASLAPPVRPSARADDALGSPTPKKRGRPRKSEQSGMPSGAKGPKHTAKLSAKPSGKPRKQLGESNGRPSMKKSPKLDRKLNANPCVKLSRLNKRRMETLIGTEFPEKSPSAPSGPPQPEPEVPDRPQEPAGPSSLAPELHDPAAAMEHSPPKKRGRPPKSEKNHMQPSSKQDLKRSLKISSKLNAKLCVKLISKPTRKKLEKLRGVKNLKTRLSGDKESSVKLIGKQTKKHPGMPNLEGSEETLSTPAVPSPPGLVLAGSEFPEVARLQNVALATQPEGSENSPPKKKRGRPRKSERREVSSVQAELGGKPTRGQLDDSASGKQTPGKRPKLSGEQRAATRVKLSGMACPKQLGRLSGPMAGKPSEKAQGKRRGQAFQPLGSVQGLASGARSGSKNGLKVGVRSGPKSRVKWGCAECGAQFALEWSLKGHLLRTHLQHAQLSVR
ncbi:serine/arginine repetitive matrix protein 1-like [Thrips palmi]|uniref:Serine/arginine repetitive matrix protein 1-like n=1 Tax=Thrips palmi TaxID=161013 RepID=A0A6P8Z130_THRPL|nr:serine/arginine repetitive matrix protein 1-like [Thrips palmi]